MTEVNETQVTTEVEKKAYDLKVLTAKLKARGLDLAEEAAVIILEETTDWVTESAIISKTPFDDVAAVAMPALKKIALSEIDKIDGEDDANY
jgi:hypothetical protein